VLNARWELYANTDTALMPRINGSATDNINNVTDPKSGQARTE